MDENMALTPYETREILFIRPITATLRLKSCYIRKIYG